MRFEPVFSRAAQATAAKLADFGIVFDHVRVVIVRPVADTVKDTTIAFSPSQADVTLDLTVAVRADGESFQAGIDFTNAGGVVFHGEGTVQSHRPDQQAPPQQISVQYVGPGATVTRIAVSPKTTSMVAPSTLLFSANTFDAHDNLVPGTPVSWTTSDPSVATISNTGALSTTGKRGTVTVTATTPTNVADNASVTVTLPPTGITLVSGGGQTGKAGGTLTQLGVVKVTASDGAGVGGVAVNFAPPTGGKVGSASVTTDGNGLASTSLTLGGAIGPQSFAAVAAGFSVAIPETATGGDPSTITAASGGGQSDTVRRSLKLPLVAKVTDQFGNPVANVAVNWARTAGAGEPSGPTSATGADGLASITYTLGSVAGTETITASVSGSVAPATFTETAVAGRPTAIATISGGGQSGRVLLPLAPFVVKVMDDVGNPVAGVPVAWTASNGTLRDATTTTDAFGQTSNIMTPGTTVGGASATATVSGGKSTSFSVTVETGPLGRMAFVTQPPPVVPVLTPVVPSIRVALQDAGGNLTGSTNAVTIALGANPGGATLTGTLTRNAVDGIATFDNLKLDKLASGYTFIASSAGVASLTSTPFAVGPGAPRSLVIVAGDGQTGVANTTAPVRPAVRIADSSGNAIAGVPVTFVPASASGTVQPATAVSTDSTGVATLTSWTFGTVAGAQSLVASSPGVPSATIHAGVVAGPAARLVMSSQPSATAASGAAFGTQPVVQLQDANGNASPQSGVTVAVAIATGGGTLGGSLTAVTDTGGRAAFTNLRINGAPGARTLAFSSTGLTATTSTSIALTVGTPAKLAFTVNPSNAQANGGFTSPVAVSIEDADGNVVTSAANSVSLAITSGTGSQAAGLTGTTTMTAANGVATFLELSIDVPSNGYTLTATSQGLASAVSTPFNITSPPPSLVASIPSVFDAVFSSVPVTLAGGGFVFSGTTVAVSGGNITASNATVINPDTVSATFNIVGGAPTSTPNVTVTTTSGTSVPLPISLFSVGTAPEQLGPSFGDGGGSPYSLDCPAGAVVTALNVRGGANVDQLQLSCQAVIGVSRVFDEPQFTGAVGGSGGSPATLGCPSNYVMVGLTGRIGSGGGGLNDMIAGVCAPVGGGSLVTTNSIGSNFSGSIAYTATCPVGLVLTGVQGGAGNLLDRTQIKCR